MRGTMQDDSLPHLVETFFQDYLQRVRGASPHTVRTYRDTLRLLFLYLAGDRRHSVADLKLTALNADNILAFLTYIESERGNSATTRNCRLAAIRSFFGHLLRHDPTHAEQYTRVLSLSHKKAPTPLIAYLEPEDVRLILTKPDRSSPGGVRDYALLLFLYNTGARIGETLAVAPGAIGFLRPYQVRLIGKGCRERICPLWPETIAAIKRLLALQSTAPEQPLFRNRRGEPLTRDGAAYVLRKYVCACLDEAPNLEPRTITPHVLRHSCAVALLQAGVDITVIRDYLGHSSVATTSRYLATNLKSKRDALEAFWKRAELGDKKARPWRPRPDLLSFLASL